MLENHSGQRWAVHSVSHRARFALWVDDLYRSVTFDGPRVYSRDPQVLREFRAILGYKRSHSKQTNIQATINAQCFPFFSYSISEVGNPKSSAIVFGLLLMYHEKDKMKAWQRMSCGFRLHSADLLPSGCF